MSELKKEIFELLDKDAEFRYAIAGYLGLGDIIKKLDEQSETMKQLLESNNRLWEEVKSLREGQDKLWESNNKLWESNNRLWEELKSLREGQDKLWQENQKIWEELKSLREGQDKLWQEIHRLWENSERLWQETRALREGQAQIRQSQEGLSNQLNGVWKAIGGLRSALGVSLEDYTAGFVRMLLEKQGYDTNKLSIRSTSFTIGDKLLEVDVFCGDPLIIGEVTTHLSRKEDALKEIDKLQERVDALESLLHKKSYIKLLAVGTAPKDVVEFLEKLSKERGITFVPGRELDSQAFSA